MENKYTADDLAEALKYLENDITFEELDDFMDSLNLDVELVNANDALYELGAEKFLDEYNAYFDKLKFKDLVVGDIITDGKHILVVLSKGASEDPKMARCLGSDDEIYYISNSNISLYRKATNLTLNGGIESIKDALKIVEEQVKKEN